MFEFGLLQEMTIGMGFPFSLCSLFLNFVTKVSFEYLMLSMQPPFLWCWSFEYVAVVSVLFEQNFTSHFFFVSLNSNRWQGNTYGTVNYLLGVNLSGPHSESIYVWFVQAEKKCSLGFGIDWRLQILRGRHFLEMDLQPYQYFPSIYISFSGLQTQN